MARPILAMGFETTAVRTIALPEDWGDTRWLPETRERKRQEKMASLSQDSALIVTCGSLQRAVIVDGATGDVLLDAVHTSTGPRLFRRATSPPVAQQLMAWMTTHHGQAYKDVLAAGHGDSHPGLINAQTPYIVGFQVRTMLRLAALETLQLNKGTEQDIDVPVRLWNNAPLMWDPYEVCVPGSDRSYVQLQDLADYFGLTLGTFGPHEQAQLALALAVRCRFFSTDAWS